MQFWLKNTILNFSVLEGLKNLILAQKKKKEFQLQLTLKKWLYRKGTFFLEKYLDGTELFGPVYFSDEYTVSFFSSYPLGLIYFYSFLHLVDRSII